MVHLNADRAAQAADNASFIRSAVDASPNKIAIVVVKGAYDHPGMHASDLDPRGGDHVAVAYYDDKTQSYKLAEMVPSDVLTERGQYIAELTGSRSLGAMFGSENKPGDIQKLAWDYKEVAAVSVDLSPEKAGAFLDSVLEKTAPGETYSFAWAPLKFGGDTCASSIGRSVQETLDKDFAGTNFPSLSGLADFSKEMAVKYGFELDVSGLAWAQFNGLLPSAILNFFAAKNGVIYGSQSLVSKLFGDGPDHITIEDGHAHAVNIADVFGGNSFDYSVLLVGPDGNMHGVDLAWHDHAAPPDEFAAANLSFLPVSDAAQAAASLVPQDWFNVHATEYLLA